MKKLLALSLVVMIVITITACVTQPQEYGQSETKESVASNDTIAEVQEEKTEPEETEKTTELNSEEINADFKEAMDAYEAFMDEYVAFMKKYQENPGDLSILTDYAEYMQKYAKFVEGFAKWENEEMTTAEASYYIDVQARVTKKLLEVAK